MSTDESTIMSESEQTAELERYMAETKKALKMCSKNDLIKAVAALLIDKQMLVQHINRLTSQKETIDAKIS